MNNLYRFVPNSNIHGALIKKEQSIYEDTKMAHVLNAEINVFQNDVVIKYIQQQIKNNAYPTVDLHKYQDIQTLCIFLQRKHNLNLENAAYFYDKDNIIEMTYTDGEIIPLPEHAIPLSYKKNGAQLFAY